MRTFVMEFGGVWLGGSAVVVADDEDIARRKLCGALMDQRWDPVDAHEESLRAEVRDVTGEAGVIYLDDGDY